MRAFANDHYTSERPEEGAMTASSDIRELAHRATDGVEVSLLWYPSSDVVSVRVADAYHSGVPRSW